MRCRRAGPIYASAGPPRLPCTLHRSTGTLPLRPEIRSASPGEVRVPTSGPNAAQPCGPKPICDSIALYPPLQRAAGRSRCQSGSRPGARPFRFLAPVLASASRLRSVAVHRALIRVPSESVPQGSQAVSSPARHVSHTPSESVPILAHGPSVPLAPIVSAPASVPLGARAVSSPARWAGGVPGYCSANPRPERAVQAVA
jgi:hypothetical protein